MVLPFFFLVLHDYPSERPGEIIPFWSTRVANDFGYGYNSMPMRVGLAETLFWGQTFAKFVYEVVTLDYDQSFLAMIASYVCTRLPHTAPRPELARSHCLLPVHSLLTVTFTIMCTPPLPLPAACAL